MKLRYLLKLSSLLCLFTITFLWIYGCGNKSETSGEVKKLADLDTVAVKVANVQSKDLKLTKAFTGTLEGEDQANIVSKILERIVSINARVGQYVKFGDLVLTLDKSGSSSQYFQAQAGYKNAEKDYKRMKALYAEGAISQQMLDGTQTAYDIAKANFEAVKNTVELTAPISGVVTAVNINVGDLTNPGMPLITIAKITKMKVSFTVGEIDLPNFAIDQVAEIYSELKPDVIQSGKINQISKSADIQSRSFEIKAIFPNTRDFWFKPGMFCRVNVELKNLNNIIVVPNSAIISIDNSSSVYVVNNGRAYKREIKIGVTNGEITEILNGLKNGETIVTLGMNNLKEGSRVHISNKEI